MSMLNANVIDVDGRMAGMSIETCGKFRFVAVDLRAEELDGSEWPSLADMQRVVS